MKIKLVCDKCNSSENIIAYPPTWWDVDTQKWFSHDTESWVMCYDGGRVCDGNVVELEVKEEDV